MTLTYHGLQVPERATLDDLPWLQELGRAMVAEAPWLKHAPLDVVLLGHGLQRLIDGLDDGVVLVVRAADKGRPIGVLVGIDAPLYPWTETHCAHEVALFVAPEHRGEGIATSLIITFEQWAFSRGLRYVVIGSASGLSPDATGQLYGHLGYSLNNQTFSKKLAWH